MVEKSESAESKEPEHVGSIWKHPYLVYILLTILLFGGLLIAAWLAKSNDWLPKR